MEKEDNDKRDISEIGRMMELYYILIAVHFFKIQNEWLALYASYTSIKYKHHQQ